MEENVTLIVDGRFGPYNMRQVIVDGEVRLLPDRAFRGLVVLACARTRTADGWVPNDQFDSLEDGRTAARLTRSVLGIPVEWTRDRQGSRRLALPSKRIRFNTELLKNDEDTRIAQLFR